MNITNCAFVNNLADELTPGFTLSSANLTVSNTIVRSLNLEEPQTSRLLYPVLKSQINSQDWLNVRSLQGEESMAMSSKTMAGFFYIAS